MSRAKVLIVAGVVVQLLGGAIIVLCAVTVVLASKPASGEAPVDARGMVISSAVITAILFGLPLFFIGRSWRRDGRRRMQLPGALLELLIASCATVPEGRYVLGGGFARETIELHRAGTFDYEIASDDGGILCTAKGRWKMLGSSGMMETALTSVSSSGCRLDREERWVFRGRNLYRVDRGVFVKQRR